MAYGQFISNYKWPAVQYPTASQAGADVTGGNLASLYNPKAYGSIPVIPPTTTNRNLTDTSGWNTTMNIGDVLNTGSTTGRSTTSGYSNTQTIDDLLRNMNTYTRNVQSWTPNFPGYEGLAGRSSSVVDEWLRGRIDPQALADAGTWAAERGIGTGVGMQSPNALAAYQHFLGLSRQAMQEKGLQGYLQLLRESPRTTISETSQSVSEAVKHVVNSMTQSGSITESQQDTVARQLSQALQNTISGQQTQQQQIIDNNVLQAMYNAAPEPMAAALANLAAQKSGIQSGRSSVPMPGGYTSVSFPRAGAQQPLFSAYDYVPTVYQGTAAQAYQPSADYMSSLYADLYQPPAGSYGTSYQGNPISDPYSGWGDTYSDEQLDEWIASAYA